jgi:hypothetical protein
MIRRQHTEDQAEVVETGRMKRKYGVDVTARSGV